MPQLVSPVHAADDRRRGEKLTNQSVEAQAALVLRRGRPDPLRFTLAPYLVTTRPGRVGTCPMGTPSRQGVVALLIERLIEHALGHRHGADAILADLRALECSDAGDG